MELNNAEVAALETVVKDANEAQSQELQALQLALVGGGIGSVILG
jgi:hypothetical protein